MNLTPILLTASVVLFIANLLLLLVVETAIHDAKAARRDAIAAYNRAEDAHTMKRLAEEQSGENRREADHWRSLHDALLVRQQRRKGTAAAASLSPETQDE